MSIGRTRLLAVRSLDEAVDLFAQLGYAKAPLPLDLGDAPLPGVDEALVARSSRRRRSGYGLVIAETSENPRSLRALAKALRTYVHDKPLAVLGVRGDNGTWTKMIVLRPRSSSTGTGVTVTKLVVDVLHPSQHDAHVISGLQWDDNDDTASQRAIDLALDVEAVTNRFFVGLRRHYDRLLTAVSNAIDDDPAVADRLKRLGGNPADRAALRILTQVLFVEFLQRKGFVEGQPDWLTRAYRTKTGPYYQTVLEPLFYEGLGKPADDRYVGAPEVPYLNGGLFDRFYGNVSLDLPDDLFDLQDGLLGYLDGWTFTVAEEMPDESEVAVDPEMLGKVFEHLAGEESVEEHGTVYTPRPVVHFMCREALVPWLEEGVGLSNDNARRLLTATDPFSPQNLGAELNSAELAQIAIDLPSKLNDLRVLDPAVGSGAFLLGMLSEIVRLRSLCFGVLNQGLDPGPHQITAWKEQAIREVLYGVDIEPRAIELCRLRLWLSLMVELPEGETPQPLPNLEFRTVVANSLTDFASGIEVQNTRGGIDYFHVPELRELHQQWFHAAPEGREHLRVAIRERENEIVNSKLADARVQALDAAARAAVDAVRERFDSPEREYPCFVPALHAPEIAQRGGWDIVIMNPPYVGAGELTRRLGRLAVRDLELHHGEKNDLMVLFGYRAMQLCRQGGIVSMIFNDTINTSSDAVQLRRTWTDANAVLALARTRCFVGKAITGGVVVLRRGEGEGESRSVRWIEGHGRQVLDFSEASAPLAVDGREGRMESLGSLEAWSPPAAIYSQLPPRVFFRPSAEALKVIEQIKATRHWASMWSRWDPTNRSGWTVMSNTSALDNFVEGVERLGHGPDDLPPGQWVMLGLCIEGGIGFQTGDDRRYLAALAGTQEADRHLRNQGRLEEKVLGDPVAAPLYRKVLARDGREAALLRVWEEFDTDLGWPKAGGFRIVQPHQIRQERLTSEQKERGIEGERCFVPFEKGDRSDVIGGTPMGARWWRENPIYIEWSTSAVQLVEARESGERRKPYRRNQHLWFEPGVGWNKVASYLRPRLVPEGSVYGDGAIVVQPRVRWLTAEALCAFLGSDVADFVLRTFSSRMNVYISDIRRIPIPVLAEGEAAELHELACRAIEAKKSLDATELQAAENDVNRFVRALFGVNMDADLWVPR